MTPQNYDKQRHPIKPEAQDDTVRTAIHLGYTSVNHEATIPPAQTSDREGYWTQPTQEQIDNAADQGYDLTRQAKYFQTPDQQK